MTNDEVLDEFRAAGALLDGHFILSSGLSSPVFLQKMFIFQDPARTERLCRALAEKAREAFGTIDVVVSPGGRRHRARLRDRAAARREGDLRRARGRHVQVAARIRDSRGARVLMVEDIITTGLSSRECSRRHSRASRQDRRRGLPDRPVGRQGRHRRPLVSLATLDIPAYPLTAAARTGCDSAGQARQPRTRRPASHDRQLQENCRASAGSTSIMSPPSAMRAADRGPDPVRAALIADRKPARTASPRICARIAATFATTTWPGSRLRIDCPLNFEMAATRRSLDIALECPSARLSASCPKSGRAHD